MGIGLGKSLAYNALLKNLYAKSHQTRIDR